MTVFERVDHLCDQWERTSPPLPSDARYLLRKLARQIVLDAAAACRGRALGRGMAARQEALKCADQVTHNLLCAEGQSVCLLCDGCGCRVCGQAGIKGGGA